MKKLFKLSRAKRMIILVSTLISVLLAVILGSTFYVSKTAKKSFEYAGGAEYVVKIKTDDKNSAAIANDVAQSIYERIDPLGVKGAKSNAEISGKEANVRVTYPGEKSDAKLQQIADLISEKPQLIFTDVYGNPIFNKNGEFNTLLESKTGQPYDPKGFVGLPGFQNMSVRQFYKYNLDPSKNAENKPIPSVVPLGSNGARVINNQGQKVEINLKSGSKYINEWTKATTYISKLKANQIITWIDPDRYLAELNNFFSPNIHLQNPGDNPMNHINEPMGMINSTKIYQDGKPSKAMLKNPINSSNYMISNASVKNPLSGSSFVIEGHFSSSEAQNLAKKINYGVSNYSLDIISSKIVQATYGSHAFQKALIAGCVVFAVIAMILIFNYGIFGILATVSISLFLFATLALYNLMGAQYSPASIAALVIGIGMSVDAVIIMFERFKADMYSGAKMISAFKSSSKKSWTTIIDSNLTTFIVAVVLFYFGTRSIIGLSITLMLSIVFTLVIMLYFTKLISFNLVKMNAYQDKKWVYGLKPKFDSKVQAKINKFDYIKNAKWFAISSGVIFLIAAIIFSIFAGMDKSFASGFSLSQEFSGGTAVTIKFNDDLYQVGDKLNYGEISKVLTSNGFNMSDVSSHSDKLIELQTQDQFSNISKLQGQIKTSLLGIDPKTIVFISNTSTTVAEQLVTNSFEAIGISMGLIILYTLIRFKWSYSIAAIIALLHDGLMVLALFAITRIEISEIFVAAILSVIGYSINDTIVTFDRVREKMKEHQGEHNKESIKKLANGAIRETLKRSLWTSATTIIAIIILMSFGNATKLSFNIAMLVGLISGTYSSIFIATWLWTKLEFKRQNIIKKRLGNNYWNTSGPDEQTVKGINDITYN